MVRRFRDGVGLAVMIDGGKNGSNEPHPMGVSSQNIHPAPGMRTILGFGVGRIVPIRA